MYIGLCLRVGIGYDLQIACAKLTWCGIVDSSDFVLNAVVAACPAHSLPAGGLTPGASDLLITCYRGVPPPSLCLLLVFVH